MTELSPEALQEILQQSPQLQYKAIPHLIVQEPELNFIINKYSLPRGLNSTKKFVEINDSEAFFLNEQRKQRIEEFNKI